ncbi:hypothetical protein QTJ16_004608 [Diplocarpon rosae]|uniref:Uncharacterized protein n=1 Tax=Diplocarpon rosae TaxID=946125 RepID=A0AAD9SZ01_9HELO|nr:hypothetical protein QTJ16_004608 [Diplocarpon rosae]
MQIQVPAYLIFDGDEERAVWIRAGISSQSSDGTLQEEFREKKQLLRCALRCSSPPPLLIRAEARKECFSHPSAAKSFSSIRLLLYCTFSLGWINDVLSPSPVSFFLRP